MGFWNRSSKSLDFEEQTLPWIDRTKSGTELKRRVSAGQISAQEAELLERWNRDGFLFLPEVVTAELIDALWRDYERAWVERPICNILVEGAGVIPFADARPRSELGHHHYRINDFHNLSEAGSLILMNPTILRLVHLILDDVPVAMQSLTFEYGSEQRCHQDFPFVKSGVLSSLVGSWVASEDVTPENGPLFYYRGSHRIPKFSFDGELAFDGRKPELIDAYEAYLDAECRERGLEKVVQQMRKGDVVLWHAALVHGGTPVLDRARTRKSFVSHYSTRTAYARDQRNPADPNPRSRELNGGIYYLWTREGHRENLYPLVERSA
ncbi:MAG TPA: phytanoyl-CoA dioxygenase family protein [Thermoanaerobaculia bacterium]